MGHDETMEMFEALAAKDREIVALRSEIERLKLQSEHADCWWDDDADFGSPEEYADDRKLKVGDEFTLRAAAYWDEKYRVKTVRDQETDEGDYDCEQLSKRREVFPGWFELKADNTTLKEKVAALEKKYAVEENQELCVGYSGNCDGNLVGIEHNEDCPARVKDMELRSRLYAR